MIERKDTASRFLCLKCHYMFWGSKKRVKEHLMSVHLDGRTAGSTAWIKGCKQPMTPEEEALFQRDPLDVPPVPRQHGKVAKVYTGSPFPVREAAPTFGTWSSWTAPDGADIWVASATNCVEQMGVVKVIERRDAHDRYFCTKCNLLFWGDVQHMKLHLRRASASVVSVCKHPATAAEEEVLKAHDEGREAEGSTLALALANKRNILKHIATSRSTNADKTSAARPGPTPTAASSIASQAKPFSAATEDACASASLAPWQHEAAGIALQTSGGLTTCAEEDALVISSPSDTPEQGVQAACGACVGGDWRESKSEFSSSGAGVSGHGVGGGVVGLEKGVVSGSGSTSTAIPEVGVDAALDPDSLAPPAKRQRSAGDLRHSLSPPPPGDGGTGGGGGGHVRALETAGEARLT